MSYFQNREINSSPKTFPPPWPIAAWIPLWIRAGYCSVEQSLHVGVCKHPARFRKFLYIDRRRHLSSLMRLHACTGSHSYPMAKEIFHLRGSEVHAPE